MTEKLIGFLLSYEEDWPRTFEALVRRMGDLDYGGETFRLATERVRIHPFHLAAPVRHHLVIDRLAWWHQHPREWLKKAMFTSPVYLLNNPFTFQSMEKHAAYSAMIRLGLRVPDTYLIPPKVGPDNPRYGPTSRKYHDLFDLPAIARELGYPVFMKPFDGGGWRGVTKVDDDAKLMETYDASGQTMMHLQKGLADYEVFVRSLGLGPQVISLKYDPDQPMHGRYAVSHGFLTADKGLEAKRVTKVINAFFRWDFNSCEAILKDGVLWPMDFANATPDVAVTSLHYYFPWTMKALYAWSAFCAVTGRRAPIGVDPEPYFEIADSDRTYDEKLEAYEALADRHFETERFEEFRQTTLGHLDEVMWELAGSSEFASMLEDTVRDTFPPEEHERFLGHFRGLLEHWREAERTAEPS